MGAFSLGSFVRLRYDCDTMQGATVLALKIKGRRKKMGNKAVVEMDVAEIRDELKAYITDVEPNDAGEQLKDSLTADIDGGVTHSSQAIMTFLTNEKVIANETGDTRIVQMLETLIEYDRKAA